MRNLPALNAFLNATSAVLLIIGYRLICCGKVEAHRRAMIAAFAVSVLFLISYLIYHSQVGSVRYQKTGAIRAVYLTILGTHTVLAALVPFLAVITLYRGLKRSDARHRRIARWTLPIWLYVSVTGVIVYLMLYQL
jgi:protein SCO1/2/putative membrane protein